MIGSVLLIALAMVALAAAVFSIGMRFGWRLAQRKPPCFQCFVAVKAITRQRTSVPINGHAKPKLEEVTT